MQWFNRKKVVAETYSVPDGNGGRLYKKRKTYSWKSKEEWVAVPTPAYLPAGLVDRARAMMAVNKGNERKHLNREWELRGIMRCSCGGRMVTHTTNPHGRWLYHYYGCANRRELRKMGPCRQRFIQAHEVEPVVWEFIFRLLKDPERIRVGMNALINQEREAGCRNTAEEAAAWAKKMEEYDRLRDAYQDQQAVGLMTLEELGLKLKGLEATRRLAQAELAALEAREERVKELERDRDALLESWADAVPEALDNLTGQEKNKVYRMLRLEVTPTSEGYKVTGALSGLLYSRTNSLEGVSGIGPKKLEKIKPFAMVRDDR